LHVQRSFWRANSKNALCWAFDCVNDNKKINITTPQTMCCIICHNNPVLNLNPKTQARKGLIIYNTMNGIATLRKHVNSNHFFKLIFFLNKKWIVFWGKRKDNLPKRDQIFLLTPYLFIFCKRTFQQRGCVTKIIFEGLGSFDCQKPSSFIICGKLVEKA
jgi:hypothetical protein